MHLFDIPQASALVNCPVGHASLLIPLYTSVSLLLTSVSFPPSGLVAYHTPFTPAMISAEAAVEIPVPEGRHQGTGRRSVYPMRSRFGSASFQASWPRDHHLRRSRMQQKVLTLHHPNPSVGALISYCHICPHRPNG